ncbi:TadE/TadG family type IV pilus assembly protein [Methyloferula stellata]|uniref:TadE/TadG family type IV pilus assembly protein n=1 Tax=Methyloferula stellata TaxID=876270 RepID=UPI00039CD36E|nr:TadE/TadG family type IV pilus assembly protein [Methyloferula stellata]
MRCRLKTFTGSTSAATAVEFGMVFLPLVLVMFGIMEFGRALWTREALQQTAIAGARCMGVVQTGCGTAGVYNASMATSFIQAQAASWAIPLSSSNITLSNTASCAGLAGTGFSQVSITYRFKTVVPVLIPSLAAGIPFVATACFPNNGP